MARITVEVSQTWQKVSSGGAVVTVLRSARGGLLMFNESPTDTDAIIVRPIENDQFNQNESKETWVRATSDGYRILVDGAL